jgi:exonuclease SbcD
VKILHTSDWHIGREFEGESLAATQAAFVDWLCARVVDHNVDVVIVAGDIWDKAVPKAEAVTLLDESIDKVRRTGAQLVMISGNHDSAPRLDFGSLRQRESGVTIVARDEELPEPFVIERGGERLHVLAIPFLDPQRAPAPQPATDGSHRARTHQNVLEDALEAGRERLDLLGTAPRVVIAHAYVAGSSTSESERHTVGGTDVVDAAIFQGFDYVALGHLHRPQEINGEATIAYSGSPLAYSFSEDHEKSVRLVEVNESGFVSASVLTIPVGRPVKVLTDSMENLLALEAYEPFVDYWISAKLTDRTHQEEPMRRLRERFAHIASLSYADVRRDGASGPIEGSLDVSSRTPEEVTGEFVADMQGRDPTHTERELIASAVASVRAKEDS